METFRTFLAKAKWVGLTAIPPAIPLYYQNWFAFFCVLIAIIVLRVVVPQLNLYFSSKHGTIKKFIYKDGYLEVEYDPSNQEEPKQKPPDQTQLRKV
jgi:hypothetical protein